MDWGRRPDHAELFITLATQALEQSPADLELRLLLMRALVTEGLFGRALCLLNALDEVIRQRAEIAGIEQQLAAARDDGRRDWNSLTPQFSANLAALAVRIDVRWIRQAWQGNTLELNRRRNGAWAIFDPAAGLNGRWRPALGPMRAVATEAEVRRKVDGRLIAPIIFDGVGLGLEIRPYFETTRDTLNGASPLIFVVEPSWLAMAAMLHLHDWHDILADSRVVLCLGSDATEQFEHELRKRPDIPIPQSVIKAPSWLPASDGRIEAILSDARAKAVSRTADCRGRASEMYSGRDDAYWAQRYREALSGLGPPLRVLALTSRFTTVLQYSTRDAMQGFDELGCETRTLIEPDPHTIVSPARSLSAICEFEPDLIFMVDHTRRTQTNLLIDGVPVMTWIQDRLSWLCDEATGAAMGPLDFCIGQNCYELTHRYGYPPERFLPCEMATNVASMTLEPGAPIPAEFDCEIAYATHASEPPDVFHAQLREQAKRSEQLRIIDAIYDEVTAMSERGTLNGALYIDQLVDRTATALGTTLSTAEREWFVSAYARPLVERILRHQTVAWAIRWARATGSRLHLYGKAWDRFEQYRPYARGVVPHGAPLAAAFRGAKINLHAGCNPALHQRIFDGLAAGGFFLIRRHGADLSHRVARAIYDWIRTSGVTLPAPLRTCFLPEPIRAEYECLRRYNGVDPAEPFVQTSQHWDHLARMFETQRVQVAGQVWPELDRVVFGTESEFTARVDHFLANPDERLAIAESMRQDVITKFSYESLLKRTLTWMTNQLERQAQREPRPLAAAH